MSPWLNVMASQFSWTMWTPTFPLLRERTAWLAACAARPALAFGEPVIGRYLAALSKAEHPMKAFDALFGLVAKISIGELSLGSGSPREQHYARTPQASPPRVDLWVFLYYPPWSLQRLRNTTA